MTQRTPQTGGLQLPTDVGVSATDAASIANAWNTMPLVDARLQAAGICPNIEPDIVYMPVTVDQLLAVDLKSYTVTFTTQLRWYNYVVRLLADIRAELLQVDSQIADIARKKRGEFRELNKVVSKADRKSVAEMEDATWQDPVYRTLSIMQQELTQAKLKVEAWGNEMERNLKTVSRQIENRKTEGQGGSREANMPGHAAGRWNGRSGND
jgi:hypothetical protein